MLYLVRHSLKFNPYSVGKGETNDNHSQLEPDRPDISYSCRYRVNDRNSADGSFASDAPSSRTIERGNAPSEGAIVC